MCVDNILQRSMDRNGLMPVSRGVETGLSTLEWAVQSGASFKQSWCEMPKVWTATDTHTLPVSFVVNVAHW